MAHIIRNQRGVAVNPILPPAPGGGGGGGGGGCTECLPTSATVSDTVEWNGSDWVAVAPIGASCVECPATLHNTLRGDGTDWVSSDRLTNDPDNLGVWYLQNLPNDYMEFRMDATAQQLSFTNNETNSNLAQVLDAANKLIRFDNSAPSNGSMSFYLDMATQSSRLSWQDGAGADSRYFEIDNNTESITINAIQEVIPFVEDRVYTSGALMLSKEVVQKILDASFTLTNGIDRLAESSYLKVLDNVALKSMEIKVTSAGGLYQAQVLRDGQIVAYFDASRFKLNRGFALNNRYITATTILLNVQSTVNTIDNGTAAPITITINVPILSLVDGDVLMFKDIAGNANTDNITISGGGVNIDGAASIVMDKDFGSVILVYDANTTQWQIFGADYVFTAPPIDCLVCGTVTNNTARWDGTDWVESDRLINDPDTLGHWRLVNGVDELAVKMDAGTATITINNVNITTDNTQEVLLDALNRIMSMTLVAISDSVTYDAQFDKPNDKAHFRYAEPTQTLELLIDANAITKSVTLEGNDATPQLNYASGVYMVAQQVYQSITDVANNTEFIAGLDYAAGLARMSVFDNNTTESFEFKVESTPDYRASFWQDGNLIAYVDETRLSLSTGLRLRQQSILGNFIIPDVSITNHPIANIAAAPISVTLPALVNLQGGDMFFFKDVLGNALTYPITINGNGQNIDGAATLIINKNYGSVVLIYDATSAIWQIFHRDYTNETYTPLSTSTFKTYFYQFQTTTGSTFTVQHATPLAINQVVHYRMRINAHKDTPLVSAGGWNVVGVGFRGALNVAIVTGLSFTGNDNFVEGAPGTYINMQANIILQQIEVVFKSRSAAGLSNKWFTVEIDEIIKQA